MRSIHGPFIQPDGNMLFTGGEGKCAGVYQSKDGGGTWALIGLQDKPNIDHLAIGLDKEGVVSIYASLFDPLTVTPLTVTAPERGIYKSSDGGTNWSFTGGMECGSLDSDPNNPSTIYCGGFRLFVKQSTGPWREIPGTASKTYTAAYIDHPNDTERILTGAIYVSTDNPYVGIFVTTDGGASWVERNSWPRFRLVRNLRSIQWTTPGYTWPCTI